MVASQSDLERVEKMKPAGVVNLGHKEKRVGLAMLTAAMLCQKHNIDSASIQPVALRHPDTDEFGLGLLADPDDAAQADARFILDKLADFREFLNERGG